MPSWLGTPIKSQHIRKSLPNSTLTNFCIKIIKLSNMEYQFQGKQKYNKSLVYSEIVFQCYIYIYIWIGLCYIIIILINSTILFVPKLAITVVKIQSRRNKWNFKKSNNYEDNINKNNRGLSDHKPNVLVAS